MNMTNKYTYTIDDKSFKIFINDLVHFNIKHKLIISYQSWVEDKPIRDIIKTFIYNLLFEYKIKAWTKKYVIEFILEDNVITTLEYDERSKWTEILKLVNEIK